MSGKQRPDGALVERLAGFAEAARGGAMPRREFLTLATGFGIGAAAAYGLLGEPAPAAAQTPEPAPAPEKGPGEGVLRIAMPVRAIRDPRLFDWPEMGEIARQFCEPLVRYRADGAIVPWLLASWEVSPDSTEFLLRLREDVAWSNGDAFEAADVVALISRWCDADIPENSMADRFGAFIDPATRKLRDGAAEIIDDHAVRLFASRPDVSVIASMTDFAALATHRDFDAEGANLMEKPVGTGPFELVSLTEGERAELKRRESGRWWGGEARLQGVVFRDLGLEPEPLKQAVAAGEIDLVPGASPELAKELAGLGLQESATDSAATVVIRANNAYPPFQDPRVMTAFQRAVDNRIVLEAAMAGEGVAGENHHVWPKHPEYAPIPALPRDLDEAKRLLKEAGQDKLEVTLISPADDWRGRVADEVAAQIREAGVKVARTRMPARLYWADWKTHPFSLTEWAMRPLGVQVMALAYRSGAAFNETGFADPVFDALLDVALEVSDLATQRLVMKRLQTRLRDAGVIIQPFWRMVRLHHVESLKGVSAHPMQALQLEQAYFDL